MLRNSNSMNTSNSPNKDLTELPALTPVVPIPNSCNKYIMNESDLSDDALAELLTLIMEVDICGNIVYRNHLGQIHRIHGPAVIYKAGGHQWVQNHKLHRTDGPAVTYRNGERRWYIRGREVSEEDFNPYSVTTTHILPVPRTCATLAQQP